MQEFIYELLKSFDFLKDVQRLIDNNINLNFIAKLKQVQLTKFFKNLNLKPNKFIKKKKIYKKKLLCFLSNLYSNLRQ